MNDISTEGREAKMTVGLDVGDLYTYIAWGLRAHHWLLKWPSKSLIYRRCFGVCGLRSEIPKEVVSQAAQRSTALLSLDETSRKSRDRGRNWSGT